MKNFVDCLAIWIHIDLSNLCSSLRPKLIFVIQAANEDPVLLLMQLWPELVVLLTNHVEVHDPCSY